MGNTCSQTSDHQGTTSQNQNDVHELMPICAPPPYTKMVVREGKRNLGDNETFTGGKVRLWMLKDPTVESYRSWPTTPVSHDVPWHAELVIDVKDLPSLMKHGLDFSERNLIRERNYAKSNLDQILPWPRSLGWTCCRMYPVVDYSEAPQWKGYLAVYVRELGDSSGFRVSDLSVNNIRWATARNGRDEEVYHFDSIESGKNYNVIYDEMPMAGLWPWPKEKETQDDRLINLS